MAHITVMEKDGGEEVTIETDSSGTKVSDENGQILTSYGYDRHRETVAEYKNGGWTVTSDSTG